MSWLVVFSRIFIVIVMLVFLAISVNAYMESRFSNFIFLIFFSLLAVLASALEVISSIQASYETAKLLYNITALMRTVAVFALTIFYISVAEQRIKYVAVSVASIFFAFEFLESLENPVQIYQSGSIWLVKTARTHFAYFSRALLVIFASSIFVYYLFRFVMKTINKKRRYYAIALTILMILMVYYDAYIYFFTYPNIDQTYSAIIETAFFTVLSYILLVDKYFYIVFSGEIVSILIYRNDGVLLSSFKLGNGHDDLREILLGNLLSAVSYLGMETLFHELIEQIKFENGVLMMVGYENIYLTLIGRNINDSIRPLLKKFLKIYYNKFRDIIQRETVTVPDQKEFMKIFNRFLAPAIL